MIMQKSLIKYISVASVLIGVTIYFNLLLDQHANENSIIRENNNNSHIESSKSNLKPVFVSDKKFRVGKGIIDLKSAHSKTFFVNAQDYLITVSLDTAVMQDLVSGWFNTTMFHIFENDVRPPQKSTYAVRFIHNQNEATYQLPDHFKPTFKTPYYGYYASENGIRTDIQIIQCILSTKWPNGPSKKPLDLKWLKDKKLAHLIVLHKNDIPI